MSTMANWRAAALRHLLGRFHIGEDIVRHLSTFQRLGETLEIAPPGEMLPVGARTLFRAVRTRGAAQIRPDWLWPYWLEAQLDPHGPAFTPRGHLPVMQNVTHRNWTLVGNLASPWEAIVDPTGLVTPWFDGWSLDWWVQARGAWHLPSRDPDLRQALVGSAPVIETCLELPSGVVRHRAYTVSGSRDLVVASGSPELVVVEVTNDTPEPVQLAFAVRPYNPEGLAVVEAVAVDGDTIVVDGCPVVALPRTPLGVALGSFATGDSANVAQRGQWRDPERPQRISDKAGLAQAAALFDLPPGEALRAAMPLDATGVRRRGRASAVMRPAVSTVADAQTVADAWHERLARDVRVELPDARLQEAVDANRAFLRLLHDPGDITAGPFTYHRFWFRDAAYQIAALARWGYAADAADVLRTYPGRQQADGFFYSQWHEWDANGAALWAAAEYHRLTGDDALLDELAPSLVKGTHWIVRKLASTRGKGPGAAGLMPAGVSAEHLGPFDYYYWDDLWAWRGLVDGAAVARRCGQPDAASSFDAAAARLRETLFASFADAAARMGCTAIPAGPTRGVDAGMIGSLAACYPLDLLAPDDPWIRGTADVIRERLTLGDAFYQGISHTGLGTYLTLQLAFVELADGDPRAWQRLRWLLDAATPTYTWPEAIHPQLPGGCMGDGHHGWMAADILNFVRMLLVREAPDGLVLLSVLPDEWQGQPIALHDAPTSAGRISYRLEWDRDIPVLRWDCERDGVRLVAPGLDPAWSTVEQRGEARLTATRRSAAGAGERRS
jgi:hypothetical protein